MDKKGVSMNIKNIKEYFQQILDENEIYGIVQVHEKGKLVYKVDIILDYEEYMKMMILSEHEITDKIKMEVDFIIR